MRKKSNLPLIEKQGSRQSGATLLPEKSLPSQSPDGIDMATSAFSGQIINISPTDASFVNGGAAEGKASSSPVPIALFVNNSLKAEDSKSECGFSMGPNDADLPGVDESCMPEAVSEEAPLAERASDVDVLQASYADHMHSWNGSDSGSVTTESQDWITGQSQNSSPRKSRRKNIPRKVVSVESGMENNYVPYETYEEYPSSENYEDYPSSVFDDSGMNHEENFIPFEEESSTVVSESGTNLSESGTNFSDYEDENQQQLPWSLDIASETTSYERDGVQNTCLYKNCAQSFGDSSALHEHMRTLHQRDGRYPCELCDKAFPSPSALKLHMRVHTGEKPFTCNVCGKGFAQAGNYRSHMARHAGLKPFTCRICQKSYADKKYYLTHMAQHEADEKGVVKLDEHPNTCDLCGRICISRSHLKTHMDMKHAADLPFPCAVCGKRFKTAVECQNHVALHSRERLHMCKICKKPYTSSSGLQSHMRKHRGTTYPCTKCSKGFATNQGRRQHEERNVCEKF